MTSAVEDYEALLGLLSEWDRAHRSGFDMAAFGNLSARTKQALRGVGFKDGGYSEGQAPLVGDVRFTETDRLLAEAGRAKLTRTEDLDESLARLIAWAPQGEQCCGCGHGGGMDENGNGEPPQCCGDPIRPLEMLREIQAGVARLRRFGKPT